MLAQPRRLLSAAIAIMLAVAFVAASLLLGAALNQTMRATAAGPIGSATVVVSGPDQHRPGISQDHVAALRATPGVTEVRTTINASLAGTQNGRTLYFIGHVVPALSEQTTLVEGRLPHAANEVVINEAAQKGTLLRVGDPVTLQPEQGAATRATIAGVIKAGVDATETPGAPEVYAPEATALAWSQGRLTLAYVSGPITADALAASPALQGTDLKAEPAEAVISARVADLTRGTAVLIGILLGFAAVSVFVSALVIANTFSILVAQRTRQLALLRCVGASAKQVFGMVIREAVTVAALASAAGLALGYGLAWAVVGLSRGSQMELVSVPVSGASLLVPVIVGLVMTSLSALVPARQATRISPMAALRVGQLSDAHRPQPATLVLGALLLVLGVAALIAGAFFGFPEGDSNLGMPPALLLGMAGGLVSFVGLLTFSSVIVPATAKGLAPLASWLGGVPGELAAENAVRNPKRAAATASALLVGVTLITMMSTAAASGQATAISEVEGKYPMDAVVSGQAQPVNSATVDAARAVPGIEQATLVPATAATVGGKEMPLYGLDPAAASVLRRPDMVAGLDDATVAVPARLGIATGQPVTLTVKGKTATLRAISVQRRTTALFVTPATLKTLSLETRPEVWVRFADGTDPTALSGELGRATAKVTPGVAIGGAAEARTQYQQIIDLVLATVVGLLAVAVVIALVGIMNTLSLSVLERRQESGLLRALGFTRTHLRRMVGLEAVLIACVATLLGVLLGLGYGIAGAYALLGTESKIVIAIPWTRVALVAAIAVAAGWLASVIPAARASRVSPAAALATE